MNTGPFFLSAFWAGVSSPVALYADAPAFRPLISSLTPANSFALVGALLNRAMAETIHAQPDTHVDNAQLSFNFDRS